MAASPDEATNIAKAAAVVRGQVIGHTIGGSLSPLASVTIPASYANTNYIGHCFNAKPSVSAACAPSFRENHSTKSTIIYNARYQPLYYAIVGVPSLFTQSVYGIYLMRFVSALLCSIFFALAFTVVIKWHKSKVALTGIVVAATPSVFFFSGMVNPIGLEVSSAICFWTSILVLISFKKITKIPKGLLITVFVSGGIESLSRSISPLWVLIAITTALCWVGKDPLYELIKNHISKLWLVLFGLCVSVGGFWILICKSTDVVAAGFPVAHNANYLSILLTTLRRSTLFYKEAVSFFGVLNTPSPDIVYILWGLMILGLVVLAMLYSTWRSKLTLMLLITITILLPATIATSQAKRLGIVWQGSDSLPIFVGIPILSAFCISQNESKAGRILDKLNPGFIVTAGLLIFIAFFADIKRYAVGIHGSSSTIFKSGWHPPLGVLGLLIFAIIALAYLSYLLIKAISKTLHKLET